MTFPVYGSGLHVSVNSQQSCLIQGTLFTVRDTGCAATIVATRRRIRGSAEYQANFTHACRLECLDKNPMTLVRQGAKRQKAPDVLELDELKMLLGELDNPARLLVIRTVAKFKRR